MGLKSFIWIKGPAVFRYGRLPCLGLKWEIAHQKHNEPIGGNRSFLRGAKWILGPDWAWSLGPEACMVVQIRPMIINFRWKQQAYITWAWERACRAREWCEQMSEWTGLMFFALWFLYHSTYCAAITVQIPRIPVFIANWILFRSLWLQRDMRI